MPRLIPTLRTWAPIAATLTFAALALAATAPLAQHSADGMRSTDWRAVITVAVLLLGFAAQWGHIATRLQSVSSRVDDMIEQSRRDTQTYRVSLAELDRRLSRIEGAHEREHGQL